MLEPTESSQDKGNFPVRSCPKENYPEWKPALITCHDRHVLAESTKQPTKRSALMQ